MTETQMYMEQPWSSLKKQLSEMSCSSVFLIMDEHTHHYCKPHFMQNSGLDFFNETIVPAGESSKSLDTCRRVWEAWMLHGMDRQSLVICLGGGMICDLGGFCASVFMRGVQSIYVPTTLMAMADAAIGGKTGVNFSASKNILGTFSLPLSVVIDTGFLSTLPERQIRSGFVEIIKHSLIYSPAYYHELMEEAWPISAEKMVPWIQRSIETKLDFIHHDLHDHGKRKALNFGHTIGHAIEACSFETGNPLLHGEAIALGMICEMHISALRYAWPEGLHASILKWIRTFAPKIAWGEAFLNKVLSRLQADKKRNKGEVLYSLLEKPGIPVLDQKVSQTELLESFEYIR